MPTNLINNKKKRPNWSLFFCFLFLFPVYLQYNLSKIKLWVERKK